MTQKHVRVSVSLPPDIFQQLEDACAREKKSRSDFLRHVFLRYEEIREAEKMSDGAIAYEDKDRALRTLFPYVPDEVVRDSVAKIDEMYDLVQSIVADALDIYFNDLEQSGKIRMQPWMQLKGDTGDETSSNT